jgi:hypothetical protein
MTDNDDANETTIVVVVARRAFRGISRISLLVAQRIMGLKNHLASSIC